MPDNIAIIPEPVTVITVLNPLKPHDREIRREAYAGEDLFAYVDNLHPLRDVTLVLSVNGGKGVILNTGVDLPIVHPGDFIAVCPIFGGNDSDKNPLAMIAMIVVMIIAVVAQQYYAVGLAGAMGVSTGTAGMIIAGGVMMGGSMLVNAVLPAAKPDVPRIGSDSWSESPTYGWGHLRQVSIQGGVIPVIYGTHRVAGQVISRTVTSGDDNNETLKIMLAVCHGPLDNDSDISDIRINDQPATYFNAVETVTRKGSNADTVIPGFDEVVTQQSYGSKLVYEVPTVKTTDGTAVNAIDVNVMAPYGCYYANDQGGIDERSAEFTIEYREVGAGSWTQYGGTYSITGATSTAIRQTTRIDSLAAAQYEVRITRTNAESDSSRERTAIYLAYISEVIKQSLIYPGVAKYAITALATDQLSGSEPAITCQVTRATVSVYVPGTGWASKNADNPAWAAWDLLNNSDYGGGIDCDRIDYTAFAAWAAYCDETVEGDTRHKLNIVIDTQTNLWQAMAQICQIGRAVPVRRGVLYSIVVDKTDTPVQLFTLGNVLSGSFKLTYLPMQDRANAIEVTFMDEDRDYTRQVVGVYSDDYNDSDEPDNKTSIRLFGCTSRTQAIREGAYRINATKYLTRTIEFEADIDAIACQVGDLIYFQHDVPEWGTGGRIVSATSATVTLDQTVTLEPATTYLVSIRLAADDSIVEKTVSAVSVTTETATLSLTTSFSSTPEKHDIFTFGVSGSYRKSYRVINISRSQDLTRKITALEYRSEVYTNPGIVLPEPPWVPALQEALAVYLHEFLVYAKSGGYQSTVAVSWYPAYVRDVYAWEIWVEDLTSATNPVKITETGQLNYLIPAQYFTLAHEYKIYVAVKGEGAVALTGNTETITIEGTDAEPADVATFSATWNNISRHIEFTWSAVPDIDLKCYEIRYGGTGWADATVLLTDLHGTTASFYYQNPSEQTVTFRIKALDTSGNYSENETTDDEYIGAQGASDLPDPTGLALYKGTSIAHDGTQHVWVRATWTAVTGADLHHYMLKLIRYPSGYTSHHDTIDVNFTWDDLLPNTTYGVTLCSVDTIGDRSAFCSEVQITTDTDDTNPGTVTWASIPILAGFKMIQLDWNPNAEKDLSHYEVVRSLNGSTFGDPIARIKSTFFTDTGLIANTRYWYKVRAVDTSGNVSGSWSSAQDATTANIGSGDIDIDTINKTHIDDDAIETPMLTTNCLEALDIRAGTVAVGKIAACTINADQVDAATLSAITANVGTLTAGVVRSNNWSTSAGVQFDLTNGTLTCGGSSSPKLAWNGTTLTVAEINASNINTGYLSINRINVGAIITEKIGSGQVSSVVSSVGTSKTLTSSYQTLVTLSSVTIPSSSTGCLLIGMLDLYDYPTDKKYHPVMAVDTSIGTYTYYLKAANTGSYAIYRGTTAIAIFGGVGESGYCSTPVLTAHVMKR